VRVFLDAHVSGRRIARALRADGHDVRAADEERELDGWDDERILALAATEGRILITCNVKDFARITGEWAAADKHHTGCLMMVWIDHAEYGLILRVIAAAFSHRPDQEAWIDYVAWGTRGSGR
jgi:nucleoside-diphosphate-sugar epimerase